ncbi:MAG: calcium/sodium antiporter [Chloroflexi bacterium]|nr:calcium/sodium antiporter [Chloroflexota bacterium]
MTLEIALSLIAGLVLLVVGAEGLVRGASRMAAALGISPLIIGLTVVAFGTSSPELAISLQSAFQGQADIAIGNVVGSNIFNILVILGLSALITPLIVDQQLIRLDAPLLLGVSLLFWWMAADGLVGRWEGGLLFAGLLVYIVFLVRKSRRETKAVQDEYAEEYSAGIEGWQGWAINLGLVALGLILLVFGSRLLVNGAVSLARIFGLSELIIGLTIIAAGTSLPEVATSVLAALRQEKDIAVGNAIGSSLFNIMAVLALTGLITPSGISVAPAVIRFDIPVMVAVTIATLPIFFTGNLIARWEGAVFLAYYIAYTLYLVLAATQHDALPNFSAVMLEFVVPLTALTLGILVVREWRLRHKTKGQVTGEA